MFETLACRDGGYTLRDSRNSQSMHSAIGPWTEAMQVYIGPSRLRERLLAAGGELVVYDVGLGIAANAVAALETARSLGPGARRELRIVSFESDTRGLEVALRQLERFPFLASWRDACATLLLAGQWKDPAGFLAWELLQGDFRETVRQAPSPELVYYDFYSPKTCPELWSRECFEAILEQTRAGAGRGVSLLTYSAATGVRLALREAGFRVEPGPSTEMKAETTLAEALSYPRVTS